MFQTKEDLIRNLKEKGVLRSENIERALAEVDRVDFLPKTLKSEAYLDEALPIGFGQTISQPLTVVFMLELLGVEEGDFILDVGAGSAWQTALLAHLTGKRGRVFAMEIVPEICVFGRNNLKKYPKLAERIVFHCQSAVQGLPQIKKLGGFDKIIGAACLKKVPPAWREQLKAGGKMVYPRGQSIFLEEKTPAGEFKREEYPGFVFVPFIEL